MTHTDVVVVGAGPNGLAAAVTMARAGLSVHLVERNDTIGGGARTAEITLPGFRHDICSAVHPMALASPFFQDFQLTDRLDFIVPEISYAHPLDRGEAGIAYRDLDRTADALGRDGKAWHRLMKPLVDRIDGVTDFTSNQLLRIPRSPIAAAAFGMRVLEQGSRAWNMRFREDHAPALLAGLSAHSVSPMPRPSSAGAGLLLGAQAHARGWAVPVGGSQGIIDAMAADLLAHGGTITTGAEVESISQFSASKAVLLDVSARALDRIAGEQLPARYRKALRNFRYGNAAAKIDLALSGPIPWTNPEVGNAGTVHLGGTREEIAHSESEVARGIHPEAPYVLVSQPTILDPSRAPAGKHVVWAYAHVPSGSTVDMTERIITQIERFAPGFRDLIIGSHHMTASELERYNPNYIGGDFSAGAVNLSQLLARPVLSTDPWRTPAKGIYLASSSTPPGPAVHGLCGFYAARSALRHEFGITRTPDLALGS
ncbi:NAD(P)/FAD-dependent oxidoreductase [Salinibacterium sp. M195]|uniref:phytoene desaturase family protein n=1 Tax=Salinibacterium sp. M195 TaxID=2583374 RepID=UPI00210201A3|nr:NAD(P)/FAD-dependent oxidoreductase [Salinibacterium sp. M195]